MSSCRPISSIKEEYQIDYEKDLVPVCPNCHAMIHRKKEPYTIEEVRSMYNRIRSMESYDFVMLLDLIMMLMG